MEPITLEELATAIDGICAIPGAAGLSFERIAFEPENVRPGDLFWSLSEAPEEAIASCSAAESRGAVAVVRSLSARSRAISPGRRRILVPNPRVALERFAHTYRRLLDTLLVGVRGRDVAGGLFALMNAALGQREEEWAFAGDDSRFLCQNLLSLRASDRYHIMDLTDLAPQAATQALAVAEPEVAVMGRRRERPSDSTMTMLSRILPSGGLLVVPGNGDFSRATRHRAYVAHVGRGVGNSHRVASEPAGPGRLRFRVNRTPFEIAAPGRHFAIPAAMAVVTARWLGRRDRQIARDLKDFQPPMGRGNVIRAGALTLVNETAAADPASLESACQALADWPTSGRRILVCDDQPWGRRRRVRDKIEGIDYFLRLIPQSRWLGNSPRSIRVHDVQERHGVGSNMGVGSTHWTSTRQVALDAPRAGTESPCLVEFTQSSALLRWLRAHRRDGDTVWLHATAPSPLAHVVAGLSQEGGLVGRSRSLRNPAAA